MNTLRLPSFALSVLLHALPLVRTAATADVLAAASPIVALLRWLGGAAAVAGSFHAVSGSSITVTSPTESRVRATNGVDIAFRVSLTYTSGSTVRSPALYEASNLPPGFNPPTKSGSIWRITGKPTASGTFANVMLTGYQNVNGNKASVPLTIVVVDAPPAITTQPANLTVTAGQTATLSVTATGGSLGYQWLKGDLEIPKATNASLTFPSTTVTDGGTYSVRISNSGGSVLSAPTVLTVIPGSLPPEFTALPRPARVHTGEAVALNAAASGDGPLSWSWSKDGVVLPGQTAPTLSILSASADDGGNYVVTVTGPGGAASAPAARVAVVPILSLGDPVVGGGTLSFELGAIPDRVYVLETSAVDSPNLWNPVTEASATGEAGPAGIVPLRFQISEPASAAGLYRVRAR